MPNGATGRQEFINCHSRCLSSHQNLAWKLAKDFRISSTFQ
jgi:hypothetical protein